MQVPPTQTHMTGQELTKLAKSIVNNKTLDTYLDHPTFRETIRQMVLLMIGSSNTWEASEFGSLITLRNLTGDPTQVSIKVRIQQTCPGVHLE